MNTIRNIREDVINVGAVAVRVPSTFDPRTNTLIFVAGGACFLGSATVSTAGANAGFPLAANDMVVVAVDGPGAKEFWAIAAAPTTMKVIQGG